MGITDSQEGLSDSINAPVTQLCKKCNQLKELTQFYARGKNYPGKYHSICKLCHNAKTRAYQIAKMSDEEKLRLQRYKEKVALQEKGLRICSRCTEAKPVELYLTKTGELYYQVCAPCRPDHQRDYIAANPEIEKQRRSKDKHYRNFVLNYIQPLKEAGCADCGLYVQDAMDFDHTCPPEEKLYEITSIHTRAGASTHLLEMLQTELAKGEFVCKNCHRIRTIMRMQSNSRRTFLSDPTSASLNERALAAYTHLVSQSCVDCQESNFLVLEFDHVQGKKKADLAQMIRSTKKYSVQDVLEEIEKCEVRCASCHQSKTVARSQGKETTEQEQKDRSSTKCPKCAKHKTRTAKMCYNCSRQEISKITDNKYGDLENLLIQLRETSFVQVAKAYNVSDTAIRKYLKSKKVDIHTLRVLE